jgi:DMSO/TMAO reductase YedYZ heme-binding membrane subunit
MSTPNGAKKVRELRRTLIVSAVIVALAVLTPFAVRSTQAWERDLDRSLQSVQRER